jgi:hypothetical protein
MKFIKGLGFLQFFGKMKVLSLLKDLTLPKDMRYINNYNVVYEYLFYGG